MNTGEVVVRSITTGSGKTSLRTFLLVRLVSEEETIKRVLRGLKKGQAKYRKTKRGRDHSIGNDQGDE